MVDDDGLAAAEAEGAFRIAWPLPYYAANPTASSKSLAKLSPHSLAKERVFEERFAP